MGPPLFLLQTSHAWMAIFTVYPSQFFSELGIIWKCNLGLCLKKEAIFHLFFSWIGKNWEVQPEQHKKIPKSLCELGKTWKYSLRLTLKNPNFESMEELWMNCKKLGPNLSFSVEYKASNLHEIRLLLFKTQWMRFSITSNFKNLSMNWEKYVFYWEKWNFDFGHALICLWMILFVKVS